MDTMEGRSGELSLTSQGIWEALVTVPDLDPYQMH